MILIEKHYHFYAAHRNENIEDKCKSLHGHTYRVTLSIEMKDPNQRTGVTILFGDLDKYIDPVIKKLDHSTLMHSKDPLCKVLTDWHEANISTESLKMNIFDFPTSAENLAKYIADQLKRILPVRLAQVQLAETDSSLVTYILPY